MRMKKILYEVREGAIKNESNLIRYVRSHCEADRR